MTESTRLIAAMDDALLIVDGHRISDAPTPRARFTSLSADPLRRTRLYCGTSSDGLLLSDDAGDTWSPVASLAPRKVTAVAASLHDAGQTLGIVYAGTEPSALYRSRDGAETWEECAGLAALPSAATWSFPPRPDTHHVRWIATEGGGARRLFVAIEAGALVHSDDEGVFWHDRVPGGPYDTHTLASAPPLRLCSAAGDGYFESDDGGASWRQPQAGLEHRYLWSVAIRAHDPGTVIVSAAGGPRAAHDAGSAESYVYRRRDAGDWVAAGDGLPPPRGTTISTLAVGPGPAGAFYAANNRGLYRSETGTRWEAVCAWPERFHQQRVQALLAVNRE